MKILGLIALTPTLSQREREPNSLNLMAVSRSVGTMEPTTRH
jgi:hypothetical protein